MTFRIGDKVRAGTMRGTVAGVDSTFDMLARAPDMHIVYMRFDNGKMVRYRANLLERTLAVKGDGFEIGTEVRLEGQGAVGRITRLLQLKNGDVYADFETNTGVRYPNIHVSNLVGYGGYRSPDLPNGDTEIISLDEFQLEQEAEAEEEPLFFGYNQEAPDVSGPPVATQEPDINWDGTTKRRGWTPEQYVQECFDAGVPDGFRGTLVSMVAEAQYEARQELRRELVERLDEALSEERE